jgi:phosphatidylglycerol lysyltransferase
MSRHDALRLVQSHGRGAASFQALTCSDLRYWTQGDACVAYAEVGDAWVAIGGALAHPDEEQTANERFAADAERLGKRARLFAFEGTLPADSSLAALQIGEQPVWDPQRWPDGLSARVRGQLRRDRQNAKVSVRMVEHAELGSPLSATRRGIDAVLSEWRDRLRMAPMGFLVELNPYRSLHERRYFVAEQAGEVVAALVAMPVYARDGWFLETMLRSASAANGAMELLFDCAMRAFAAEGSRYVTFGLCPLSGASSPLLCSLRKASSHFYNFDGLRKFKAKLGPSSWEPVYLVYPKTHGELSAVWDAARAFLPGGVLKFAWRTLIQRAQDVSRALAYLVLPWSLALASASERWFPSRMVQVVRSLLDFVLIAGLLSLSSNFKRTRATQLAALAALDFVISAAQLASFNASHVTGTLEALLCGVGLFGPLLISIFLFASRARAGLHAPGVQAEPGPALTTFPAHAGAEPLGAHTTGKEDR